jgi:protein O-mannosyl-transferase
LNHSMTGISEKITSEPKDGMKIHILAFLGILGVVLLAFGSSLAFQFLVRSDDQAYIYRNPFLQNLTFDNLRAIFSSIHFDSYLPMTLTSYSLDYTFWKSDPFGYHLTQIFLHTCNSFLVFLILMRVKAGRLLAFSTALIYAVHPVHVESVVWVAERKNLLSGFFIFLSLYFYIRFTDREKSGKAPLIVSWFLFVLALLSKSIAVMLPLVFILYDLCIAKRGLRLLEKIPFFFGSLVCAWGTIFTQSSSGAIKTYAGGSFFTAMLFSMRVYLDYLVSLMVPVNLSPHYFYARENLSDGLYILSYLLVPAVIFYAVKNFRSRPYLAFAVGWFVLWLLPVSNLVPLTTIRQDRYLYLPSVAVFLFGLGAVMNTHWFRVDRRRSLVLAGLLIVALTGATIQYSYTFASSRAFWLHVAAKYPQWSEAQFAAGYQCWITEDKACAVRHYRQALKANPENAVALNNYGAILIDEGNYSEAKTYIEKARQADPGYASPYKNMAVIAKKTGQNLDRIPEWKKKFDEIRASAKKRTYQLGEFKIR